MDIDIKQTQLAKVIYHQWYKTVSKRVLYRHCPVLLSIYTAIIKIFTNVLSVSQNFSIFKSKHRPLHTKSSKSKCAAKTFHFIPSR